ncbi:MAG: hypothetical protein WCC85_19970, partial [Candidatus Sulfotelmatobacter sp.]
MHLCFGLAFTIGHILLKMPTPYAYWDPALNDWTSALWSPQTHVFRVSCTVLQGMFMASVVDDV